MAWDTQKVLDMVLWMREFNKSGKGRVQFTGFDMQTPGVAEGIVSDFVARADQHYIASVRQAIDQSRSARPAPGFGVATATFPVKDAAGKRVRFSGYIKTEAVTNGYAGLWWRVDGASGTLAFDNMQSRGVTGTTDWKRYDIETPCGGRRQEHQFWSVLSVSGDGFEHMGASLRKMYDGQMVVFGFAFNQGSFQAKEQGKGLHLRDAPKSGPVATWLSEPHKARSIGSGYSEDLAAQFFYEIKAPQSFDAMLFVEKTTAARKNP